MWAVPVAAILLVACVGVRAQTDYDNATTTDGCYGAYLQRTRNSNSCAERFNCAKCFVRVKGYFDDTTLSFDLEEYLADLRRYLDQQQQCQLDFYSVFEALKRDLLGQIDYWLGFFRRTTPPAGQTTRGYGDDDNDGAENACLDNLITASRYGRVNCSQALEYVRCLVRARRLHLLNLSRLEIYQTEIKIQVELVKLGVFCIIDLESIIEEVRRSPTERPPYETQPPYVRTTTRRPYEPQTTTRRPYEPQTTTRRRPYEPQTTTTRRPYEPQTTTTRRPYEPQTTTTRRPYEPQTTTTRRPYEPQTTTTRRPYEPQTTTRRWYVTRRTRRTTRYPTTTRTPRYTTSRYPTDPPRYPTDPPQTGACVGATESGCNGRTDGDYPACFPLCQTGVFITCSNGTRHLRDCPLGYYGPRENLFQALTVYDPTTRWCQLRTSYCPRNLDNQITPDK